MTNPTPNHEPTPEAQATSKQAQDILDQVDRITEKIDTLPALEGLRYDAPKKIVWHNGLLFMKHPEGLVNIDDPNSIILASVCWNNPDRSRMAYSVELSIQHGLHLTRHLYPPSSPEGEIRAADTAQALSRLDFKAVRENATADLAEASSDAEARRHERALGLHMAGANEANALITQLLPMQPAPKKRF